MNKNHLLWWIFNWLEQEYPTIMNEMLARLEGDKKHPWVKAALLERFFSRDI